MKRSTGPSTPLGGPAKRFDKMRSSGQMQLQQQYHQQMQHSPSSNHQGFFSTPPPTNMGMMPYNRNVPPPGPYAYNRFPGNWQNPRQQHQPFHNKRENEFWENCPKPPGLDAEPSPTFTTKIPQPPEKSEFAAPPPPPPGVPRWNYGTAAPNYGVPPPQSPMRPPLPRGPAMPPPPQPPLPDKDASGKIKANNTKIGNEEDDSQTVVNKKPKRKSMSSRYGCPKEWVREDAIKAIQLEEEYSKRSTKAPTLLLRFPDPELNRDIISKYSTDIESVHFQQNSAPRYCFVHLKEGADVDQAIETISKIPFGTGFVSAELKRVPASVTSPSNPDEVDPYTLYIGNLPTTISSHTVKEHFPGAHRIDIGFAQRMKYTRYAFVRYDTVEEAMEAFKRSVNTLIESRSLIVRFRRQRSTIASGEPVPKKDDDKRDPYELKKPNEQQVKGKNLNQLKALPHSFVFDSPTSLELLSVNIVDAKNNNVNDADKWKRKAHEKDQQMRRFYEQDAVNAIDRRTSLEQMFGELEKRDSTLKSNPLNTAEHQLIPPDLIKVEKPPHNDDDESSEDEPLPENCLLGSRYTEDVEVKQEPEDPEETPNNGNRDEMYNEDFEYYEDFDLEEPEDAIPSQNAQKHVPAPAAPTENVPNTWEIVRQRELSETEKKPDITELRASVISADVDIPSCSTIASTPLPADEVSKSNTTAVPFTERANFIEELYEQVKRSKDSNKRKRPRDELDAMFAQMNSDAEEDDDFF